MKRTTLLVLLLAFVAALAVIPALAQDPTATPEAPVTDVTATSEDMMMDTTATVGPVAHVRIAYLSAEGPVLTPYLDHEPSSIQVLDGPTITGWADLPVGSELSFVAEGGTQPSIGPVTASSAGQFLTVVINGADGALSAFTFSDSLTPLPIGCAQITVFNALSGDAALDLTTAGSEFGPSVTVPGTSSASATDVESYNNCVTAEQQAASGVNPGGSVTCSTVGTMAAMPSTEDEDMTTPEMMDTTPMAEMTEEATASPRLQSGSSQRYANCGVTFIVPAGVLNLQGAIAGASSFTLNDVEPNTFYLILVGGTADSPEVLVQSVAESQLYNLGGFAQTSEDMDMTTTPDAMATPEEMATVEPTSAG